MPDISQIASAQAHAILSQIITASIHVEGSIVRTAKCPHNKIQVIITIADYEPMLYVGPPPKLPLPDNAPISVPKPKKLTPLQESIVGVLSFDKPAKATLIAAKVSRARGYECKCSGTFRGMLADMVRFGIIGKTRGGYVLPRQV